MPKRRDKQAQDIILDMSEYRLFKDFFEQRPKTDPLLLSATNVESFIKTFLNQSMMSGRYPKEMMTYHKVLRHTQAVTRILVWQGTIRELQGNFCQDLTDKATVDEQLMPTQVETYQDVLAVSAYKPLGYLENGYDAAGYPQDAPLAYIPDFLLNRLLAKPDIYILAEKVSAKGVIHPREEELLKSQKIILLNNPKKPFMRAHVFHLPSFLTMLELNREDACHVMNIKNSEHTFTIDDVVQFISAINVHNHPNPYLIDALFADPSINYGNKKVHLTAELQHYYAAMKKNRKLHGDEAHFVFIQALAEGHPENSISESVVEIKPPTLWNQILSALSWMGMKIKQGLQYIGRLMICSQQAPTMPSRPAPSPSTLMHAHFSQQTSVSSAVSSAELDIKKDSNQSSPLDEKSLEHLDSSIAPNVSKPLRF